MIAVGVHAASGRMGRWVLQGVLEAADLRLAAASLRPGHAALGQDAGRFLGLPEAGVALAEAPALARAEVIIDFSLPEALDALLDLPGDAALVVGTTGLSPALQARLAERARRAPVVQASNFSPGVTALLDLVARAAAALPDHHVEIVEMHHRHKVDAPSGTALSLGEAAARARGARLDALAVHGRQGRTGARGDAEIGLHALRGGDVVGEHTVYLAGPGERLALGHLATSREAFARGALRAARWARGRAPGLYDMRDVLGTRGDPM